MYGITKENIEEMTALETDLITWINTEYSARIARDPIFEAPSTEYKATKRYWLELSAAIKDYHSQFDCLAFLD